MIKLQARDVLKNKKNGKSYIIEKFNKKTVVMYEFGTGKRVLVPINVIRNDNVYKGESNYNVKEGDAIIDRLKNQSWTLKKKRLPQWYYFNVKDKYYEPMYVLAKNSKEAKELLRKELKIKKLPPKTEIIRKEQLSKEERKTFR